MTMELQLAGEDAYVEDLWERLPKDTVAFSHENVAAVQNQHLSSIGQIFARNKVQDRLGLYLNHRHFELEPNERLVQYGLVQTPWQLSNTSAHLKSGISPKTWAFFEDRLVPTEFQFSPNDGKIEPVQVPTDFVEELREYLHGNNLIGSLGLSVLPDDDVDPQMAFEITVGRVSAIVPKHRFPEKELTDVAWYFDEDGAKIARICLSCNSH